jgi:hypothetical protein
MGNDGQIGVRIGYEVPNGSNRNRPECAISAQNFGTDLELRFQSLPERLFG